MRVPDKWLTHFLFLVIVLTLCSFQGGMKIYGRLLQALPFFPALPTRISSWLLLYDFSRLPKWRACSQARSEPLTSHSQQTSAHPVELKQCSVKLSMYLCFLPMDVKQVKFNFRLILLKPG